MNTPATAPGVRALQLGDLDSVVAIDAALSGRGRRGYFERRVASAVDQPDLHLQLAALDDAGAVCGYVMARRITGEFGRTAPGLRIEVLGLRADAQRRGVGGTLLQVLTQWGQRHGVAELRTIASWRDHAMLQWLDRKGFELAADQILACRVADGWQAERDDALDLPDARTPGHETDYGAPEGNDFERSQRQHCDVRPMVPGDLQPILRIDRALTGRDRQAYIEGKLGEAMLDSGVRVSLTARLDDAIVGFLMARADLGDFGRTEPVAVLDTIGIDPAYGRQGVAHALVSQLFANLAALHIDQIETLVAPTDQALHHFLTGVGFRPTQRLAFRRAVG